MELEREHQQQQLLLERISTIGDQSQALASNSDIIDVHLSHTDLDFWHQKQKQRQKMDKSAIKPTTVATVTTNKSKKLFPQKLWDLINDDKYRFCLRWSEDGQLVYLNRDNFEDSYLKTPANQFHTQKAISFVRQMNMYGFRKVDDCYYENDNFKRNCGYLLKNMIRRHPNKNSTCNLDLTPQQSATTFSYNNINSNNNQQNYIIDTSTSSFYQASPTLASSVAAAAAAAASLLAPVGVNFLDLVQHTNYPFYTAVQNKSHQPNNRGRHIRRKLRPLNLSLRRHDR